MKNLLLLLLCFCLSFPIFSQELSFPEFPEAGKMTQEQAKKLLKALLIEMQNLQDYIVQKKKQENELKQKVWKLETQIKDLKNQTQKDSEDLKLQQKQLDDLNKELETVKKLQNESQTELTGLQADLSKLENIITGLRKSLRTHKTLNYVLGGIAIALTGVLLLKK